MRDRNTTLHCFKNFEMILDVEFRPALDQLKMRAEDLASAVPIPVFTP
jgi:hypothetical protein